MNRRSFLTTGLAAGAVALAAGNRQAEAQQSQVPASSRFKLKYAPSFGMFEHHAGGDPIDQIKFAYDQGFGAVFDNGIMGKSKSQQETITQELDRLGMDLGPFVLYADFKKTSFVLNDSEVREMLVNRMREGVEAAKRVNAKTALVVPGRYDERLEWSYQTANVIENLKHCAEVFEGTGVVIVIEPLNTLRNHPGLFLTKIPQAYQICRAVDSPACKIVNDIYHQQITEGNIIPNIDMAWSEIAAFHIGDNPGRKEPTTGEINYRNIFKHIHEKGYDGVLCMEHSKSKSGKEGEKAVIEAYRWCDDF